MRLLLILFFHILRGGVELPSISFEGFNEVTVDRFVNRFVNEAQLADEVTVDTNVNKTQLFDEVIVDTNVKLGRGQRFPQ